jgi:predicted anti-sigma-YlaC factor YlaD
MKDSCSSVADLLEKYFDREASEKESALVESHVSACPACREVLRGLEEIRASIKIPIEEAARKEDFPWVWQKIEREIQRGEKPAWWRTLLPRLDLSFLLQRKVWVPAAVTIMILLLVTAPFLLKKSAFSPGPTVVEYVESQACNVMVYESEKGSLTVIWLFEEPGKEPSTS